MKATVAEIIAEFRVEEIQDLWGTNNCIKEVDVLIKKQGTDMENGSTSSQNIGEIVSDKNYEDNVSKKMVTRVVLG